MAGFTNVLILDFTNGRVLIIHKGLKHFLDLKEIKVKEGTATN